MYILCSTDENLMAGSGCIRSIHIHLIVSAYIYLADLFTIFIYVVYLL